MSMGLKDPKAAKKQAAGLKKQMKPRAADKPKLGSTKSTEKKHKRREALQTLPDAPTSPGVEYLRIMIGTYDGGILCIEGSKGEDTWTFERVFAETPHKGAVKAVTIDDTGTLAATGSSDETICFYDLRTKRLTGSVMSSGERGSVFSYFIKIKPKLDWVVHFAASGEAEMYHPVNHAQLFATTCRQRLENGKLRKKSPDVQSVAPNPEVPSLCLVNYLNGDTWLWSLEKKHPVSKLTSSSAVANKRVKAVSWTNNGKLALFLSKTEIEIRHLESGHSATVQVASDSASDFSCISPLGESSFVVGTTTGNLEVYTLTSSSDEENGFPYKIKQTEEPIEAGGSRIKLMQVLPAAEQKSWHIVTVDADGFLTVRRAWWKDEGAFVIEPAEYGESTEVLPTALSVSSTGGQKEAPESS